MENFNASTYLKPAGLRLTRPRQEIARLLFADGEKRHVTAEIVADLLEAAGESVALATVYNTLHAFVEAGLLREFHGVNPLVTVFDTNVSDHHHFYDELTGALSDIEAGALQLSGLPVTPEGKTVSGFDLIVRIR
jgi:Fur family transcriptional regulator, iron response regulator